jgi:hypothetical protein
MIAEAAYWLIAGLRIDWRFLPHFLCRFDRLLLKTNLSSETALNYAQDVADLFEYLSAHAKVQM